MYSLKFLEIEESFQLEEGFPFYFENSIFLSEKFLHDTNSLLKFFCTNQEI